MEIKVRTHHLDITPSLKEYAYKKMEKLEKFFDNIQEIVIELNVESVSETEQRQVAMGTIWASGTVIRAKESSSTMYASIDLVFDKLEKQLRRYKEKLRDSRRGSNKRSITESSPLSSGAEAPVRRLTRQKEEKLYIPKPMDPEEAAEIVETQALDFLVFRNIQNEKVSVVYPIGDGEFGVIEP